MSKHTDEMLERDDAERVEPLPTAMAKPASASSRSNLSVLRKFSFWSYLVTTVLCAGVSIAVTLTAGYPNNLTILISTAVLLVSTLLIRKRALWASLFSLVLGIVVLYLVFTEPFVLESLAAPKTDPQGGFGHFSGVVTIISVLLLAFGANVGVVMEDFRHQTFARPRWLPSAVTLVAGMAIGALLIGAIGQPAASGAGTTYTNGVATVHMSAASFIQTSITISKGSKLLLVDDVSAVHILANGSWQNGSPQHVSEPGAPQLNNVQINGNSITIGPFVTTGTYHIYCIVHSGMNLTVIVQ
ncbi:MAG TPA: hypothetical protein VGD98_09500 [Ktedonobacteraceae bacterium]